MHIGYRKTSNGTVYATLSDPIYTENGKKDNRYTYLGKVIDKEKGIFWSKERGTFSFNLKEGGFLPPPLSEVTPQNLDNRVKPAPKLCFGDAFLVYEYIYKIGFLPVIESIPYENHDTLKSLILSYIISPFANCDTENWYYKSVAKYLFPKANLSSQRISDCLASIGDPNIERSFFSTFIPYVQKCCNDDGILIDSSNIKNDINIYFTKYIKQKGAEGYYAKLIYVVNACNGIPIFYRLIPGNVLDVNTLNNTLKHLEEYSVKIGKCLFDAGFNSNENFEQFYNEKNENIIDFITRIKTNDKQFKQIVENNFKDFESNDNFVKYLDRYLFIKEFPITIGPNHSYPAYLYLAKDVNRKNEENEKILMQASTSDLPKDKVYEMLNKTGFFGLISASKKGIDQILPAYYQRQAIEETFDFSKNYTRLLPLRTHNENTLKGHLLLSFIACFILKCMQVELKYSDRLFGSKLKGLSHLICDDYTSRILIEQPQKNENDIFKALSIECPSEIKITDYKLEYNHTEQDSIPKWSTSLKNANNINTQNNNSNKKRKVDKEEKTDANDTLFFDQNSQEKKDTVQQSETPKRGRGRPPGRKNNKTLERLAKEAQTKTKDEASSAPKRGRGRPPGRKNNKTLERLARLEAEASRKSDQPNEDPDQKSNEIEGSQLQELSQALRDVDANSNSSSETSQDSQEPGESQGQDQVSSLEEKGLESHN